METVLVADDEPKILDLVAGYLEAAGFKVVKARDGKEALASFRLHSPDCLILDINMPGMDGLSVAREIRKSSEAPIIFLTALAEELDRVVGLELGADDYIAKPFSPRELVARVKAVLRRTSGGRTPGRGTGVETRGMLRIDIPRREVVVDGRIADLTAAQFDLLEFLSRSPGRVWTRAEILEGTMGPAHEGYERTIDAHIKNLRKALGDEAESPRFIETLRGAGYRFMEGS